MPSFLCDYQNEAVVLSNGQVTTCCMDPMGTNDIGSIYREDFAEIERRYLHWRGRVVEDVHSLPRCTECYVKIEQKGFPKTGTYVVDPDPARKQAFLAEMGGRVTQLVIELTAICNLKCVGCPQSWVDLPALRGEKYLDVPKLQAWLEPGLRQIRFIRLYNYSETFIHPESFAFIAWAKRVSPATRIQVAANGLTLGTPAKRRAVISCGVDELVFSIHGDSQESVQKYMTEQFQFDRLMAILEDLVALRREAGARKPRMIWKYLLFAWNDTDEQIARARATATDLGLDGMIFDLPGKPAPSIRFSSDRAALAALNRSVVRLAG